MERQAMEDLPFDEDRFRKEEVGAPELWKGEQDYSILERIGARPTLELHGIRGGFVDEGQKTVIPAQVMAKVSMRLVSDQDPEEIGRLFEARIRELAPPTVEVQVRIMSTADAAVVDPEAPVIQAAAAALRQSFGADPVYQRTGGTLPVVAELQKALQAPVVMMGYGMPDDNIHAPNEKFGLDQFYRGILNNVYFMHSLKDYLG
jgi:acetylornithine deacetylase/succinyl-diaminopimelate desuccinylase-like protein